MKGRRSIVVTAAVVASISVAVCAPLKVSAQNPPAEAPLVTAVAKGPNQINLAWLPLLGAIYGYIVEIRSSNDSRYANWTEMQPIAKAGGYTCESSIVFRGATCNISDPMGVHVYNPPLNGVPYWVTDGNYTDPQDDSPAQFIAWGLRPNTAYNFRVRAYSGSGPVAYGPYSNVAVANTAAYELRYVAPSGNDVNAGTAPDAAHAWRTLAYAARRIVCGQALIVMGGEYANDAITMQHHCSADKKVVVMVNPGDTATITSMATSNAWHPVLLLGSHIVIDGLRCITPSADYDFEVDGDHDALFNIEAHPQVIPTAGKGGVYVTGSHNLVYRSTIHDYGSPDQVQNPNGDSGFVLTLQSGNATHNVIWGNHLTRGGHDVALCKGGCTYNRFLNNVMDGGWGMGFEAVGYGGGSDHNLIEGNIFKDVGQLVSFYKPSIEVSGGNNTVRRNVSFNAASKGVEESAFGGNAANNLIYNNVFYAPETCLFQSSAGGSGMYDNDVYANNICYKFKVLATDIYSGNKTNRIARNVFAAGEPEVGLLPDKAIIVWNHSAGSPFEYPKSLAYADSNYEPVFSGNKGLDVDPRFVNEMGLDFHLSNDSPLIGKGVVISDPEWGTAEGAVDLGAFGIHSILRQPRPLGKALATHPTHEAEREYQHSDPTN